MSICCTQGVTIQNSKEPNNIIHIFAEKAPFIMEKLLIISGNAILRYHSRKTNQGLLMDIIEECSFCSELLKDDSGNIYYEECQETSSRIIWENDNFAILPTLGCFIEGYLLIITKRHVSSLSELKVNNLLELTTIINKVYSIMNNYYGGCIFFEHGSVSSCTTGGGACVDHAHLHIIPRDISLINGIKNKFQVNSISSLLDLSKNAKKGISYMFFSLPNKHFFMCDALSVESQFLRKIAAKEVGMDDYWNWAKHPMCKNIRETRKALTSEFKELLI